MIRFVSTLFLLMTLSGPAHAFFSDDIINSKVQARAETQWNLWDWLAQKKQFAQWDAWLAMNKSANIFDLTLSGGARHYYYTYTLPGAKENTERLSSAYYNLDMYISILNIQGEYEVTENFRESYGGSAGLRLLGTSTQDTSLIARYGWRRLRYLTTQEQWDNYFVEGQLQIYLASFLGVDGSYRHYYPSESNKDSKFSGYRATFGGFIEYAVFRLYGNAFQEPVKTVDSSGAETVETRLGGEVGIKMLF